MNAKVILISGFLNLMLAVGCSSSPHKIETEVINNSFRSDKTPEWVLSSKMMKEENGQLVFVYHMHLDGDARPDACIAMARSQAVAEMLHYIKNSVTNSGQVEDLNASSDPSYSSLTAFLSQGTISGAQVSDTYWEVTREADSTGLHPVKKLMCATKVGINKALLEKQMQEVINGAPGGNPEVRKKLVEAQKNFLDKVDEHDAPAQ